MALYRIISEIKRNTSRNRYFYTSPCIRRPLLESPRWCYKKTKTTWLPDSEKSSMFSYFHTITAFDRQTGILRRHCTRLCRASCGKNAQIWCMYIFTYGSYSPYDSDDITSASSLSVSERNWKLTYFSNLIRTLFCSSLWFSVAVVVLGSYLLLRPR